MDFIDKQNKIDLIDEASSKVRLKGFPVPEKQAELEKQVHALGEQLEQALMQQQFEQASEIKAERMRFIMPAQPF